MFKAHHIDKKLLKPEYAKLFGRKRKLSIYTCESVTLSGTYWDGGSRSSYTGIRCSLPSMSTSPPQFGGDKTPPTVEIGNGKMVLENGVFCGKPNVTLWVHPDDYHTILKNGDAS